jgi:hypothetical protein
MSHQETVIKSVERLSRFPSLLATGSPKPIKYTVDYGGN